MGLKLNPFFRCGQCQKLHTRLFVGPRTLCACGHALYKQVWGVR